MEFIQDGLDFELLAEMLCFRAAMVLVGKELGEKKVVDALSKNY